MIEMWKLRGALRVALDYIKYPYTRLDDNEIYSDDAHDHICFARRLMGSAFKDVCPHYNTGELDRPELSDCCDNCPYFGIIDFCADESGERSIKFAMHKEIVDTFEDFRNEKEV